MKVTDFKFRNSSVKNYAKICKCFAQDTSEWGGLDWSKYYTTNGSSWEETPDNAHDGVDVSWAFHLSEEEINQRAGEELFEQLLNEINLADNDGWDSESFEVIYHKFNF